AWMVQKVRKVTVVIKAKEGHMVLLVHLDLLAYQAPKGRREKEDCQAEKEQRGKKENQDLRDWISLVQWYGVLI
ncbi:hypothetical protein lerEdw1_016221, partial [Lerista edwardsae]